MYINGSDIDGTKILEYWRMSRAFKVSRYERLQWIAEQYSNLHFTVPIPWHRHRHRLRCQQLRVRAYKAADILTRQEIN